MHQFTSVESFFKLFFVNPRTHLKLGQHLLTTSFSLVCHENCMKEGGSLSFSLFYEYSQPNEVVHKAYIETVSSDKTLFAIGVSSVQSDTLGVVAFFALEALISAAVDTDWFILL